MSDREYKVIDPSTPAPQTYAAILEEIESMHKRMADMIDTPMLRKGSYLTRHFRNLESDLYKLGLRIGRIQDARREEAKDRHA